MNPTAWPRCISAATVVNSPTGWNWSLAPSRLVRRPADEVTAAACSRRATTSRTGRSPTLVTVPVTVTVGSLVVVIRSGVTLSTRTCRNGADPGSPAAAGAVVGIASKASRPRITTIRGRPPTRLGMVTFPVRSRSSAGRIDAARRRRSDGCGCANAFGGAGGVPCAAAGAARRLRRTAAVGSVPRRLRRGGARRRRPAVSASSPTGTQATSVTSRSSSHSSPPENCMR